MSSIDVRPSAVIVHGGKVLLLRQTTWSGQDLWVLPGGKLEPGEGLAECLVRETAEETGLRIRLQRLLYVGDFIIPGKHNVDLAFLARKVSGRVRPRAGEITETRWVAVADLAALRTAPEPFFTRIVVDAPRGFPQGAVYVGRYGKAKGRRPA